MFLFDPVYWECFSERAKSLFIDKPRAAVDAAKRAYEIGSKALEYYEKLKEWMPRALGVSMLGGAALLMMTARGGHSPKPPDISDFSGVIPEATHSRPSPRPGWLAELVTRPRDPGFASRRLPSTSFVEAITPETLAKAAEQIRI